MDKREWRKRGEKSNQFSFVRLNTCRELCNYPPHSFLSFFPILFSLPVLTLKNHLIMFNYIRGDTVERISKISCLHQKKGWMKTFRWKKWEERKRERNKQLLRKDFGENLFPFTGVLSCPIFTFPALKFSKVLWILFNYWTSIWSCVFRWNWFF